MAGFSNARGVCSIPFQRTLWPSKVEPSVDHREAHENRNLCLVGHGSASVDRHGDATALRSDRAIVSCKSVPAGQ